MVSDVLIFADTGHSAELRHELPVAVGDPILYAERNGDRHVFVASLEIPVIEGSASTSFHPLEEFGVDELRRTGCLTDRDGRRDRGAGGP